MDANKQGVNRLPITVERRWRCSRRFAPFAGGFCLSLLLCLSGCKEKEKAPPTAAPPAATSVTLRVAVVEDTALSEAIKRLRGEWSERSGGQLVVEEITIEQLLATREAKSDPFGDLLIFPSRHLGELCEAKRLRPMRRSVLESEELRINDFFPQVRERLIVFGGETMALPIGCVAPVMATSSCVDPNKPPVLWRDLDERLSWVAQASGWRCDGQAVIEVAGCFASHPNQDDHFFDLESMNPRLPEAPFLRAVDGVVRRCQRLLLRSTMEIRSVGNPLAMRLAPQRRGAKVRGFVSAVVSPLPGVDEVYNPIADEWEPVVGEPRRVPLLATSGRLIGVTTESRNAASAFRLAAWLAGPQNARQLSTCSPNVANVRKSLARVADDWTGRGDKELGKQFSAAQESSHSGRYALLIPRIIRVDDYLAALDAEIQKAITGELSPEEALKNAAAAWEALTDEIGRDRQRGCYQAHLQGLGG